MVLPILSTWIMGVNWASRWELGLGTGNGDAELGERAAFPEMPRRLDPLGEA